MKLVTVLVLVVFAVSVKGIDEMMMKVVEACKTSTGASEEDVKNFMKHAPAANKVQKCLISCIMGGIGVVREQQKFFFRNSS
jgi:hypothetical protein